MARCGRRGGERPAIICKLCSVATSALQCYPFSEILFWTCKIELYWTVEAQLPAGCARYLLRRFDLIAHIQRRCRWFFNAWRHFQEKRLFSRENRRLATVQSPTQCPGGQPKWLPHLRSTGARHASHDKCAERRCRLHIRYEILPHSFAQACSGAIFSASRVGHGVVW